MAAQATGTFMFMALDRHGEAAHLTHLEASERKFEKAHLASLRSGC